MSSRGQSSLSKKSGSGTETDPYLIDHQIERLAARIDIMPHVQRYKLDDKTHLCNYCYNVTQTAGTDIIGGFVLEYVRPYNVLTSKEYVFRRTATDASLANLKYLGLEEADGKKQNTNYVVDPTSQDKSLATFNYPKILARIGQTLLMSLFIRLVMPERPILILTVQGLVIQIPTIPRPPIISSIT